MATFKIKLEDKAAFLNRMEKQGVGLDSTQIVDDKLKGYFEVTIEEPKQLQVAKGILKQSPKINTIKEMENNKKKMTKDELKEMVRQELQAVLAEKKKVKGEEKLDEAVLEESPAAEILSILAGVAGLGLGSAAIMKAQDVLKAKKPELFKKLQGISGAIGKADPSKKLEETEEVLEESPVMDILGVLAGVGGLGLGSAAIMKLQDKIKQKNPELYAKLQKASSAISSADPSKKL
jgi:protein subunit release factor A